jgi:ribosomal protein S4
MILVFYQSRFLAPIYTLYTLLTLFIILTNMSGKIYNKNLTFLRDQPFAENFLTGFSYKKRSTHLPLREDSSFPTQLSRNDMQSPVGTQSLPLMKVSSQKVRISFGSIRVRNKSEKMKKAEVSLVRHFCSLLERTESLYTRESVQNLECSHGFKVSNVIPHLLVSVDSMQNTLLATRGSRTTERIKPPSQFKKVLQECRKIRLLYGNLSKRHLSRATNKMGLPGENLLIWLESRLDVVLERCGFFGSVKAARQSVLSGKILVNSKIVRSPGFLLEGGDFIKIVQERLLLDSLNKQFSRGVILSNGIFPHLVRNKSLAAPVSKTLPESTTITHLKPSLPSSAGYSKTADTIFGSFHSTVWDSPYNSFFPWLLKKTENTFQPSDFLSRQSFY